MFYTCMITICSWGRYLLPTPTCSTSTEAIITLPFLHGYAGGISLCSLSLWCTKGLFPLLILLFLHSYFLFPMHWWNSSSTMASPDARQVFLLLAQHRSLPIPHPYVSVWSTSLSWHPPSLQHQRHIYRRLPQGGETNDNAHLLIRAPPPYHGMPPAPPSTTPDSSSTICTGRVLSACRQAPACSVVAPYTVGFLTALPAPWCFPATSKCAGLYLPCRITGGASSGMQANTSSLVWWLLPFYYCTTSPTLPHTRRPRHASPIMSSSSLEASPRQWLFHYAFFLSM